METAPRNCRFLSLVVVERVLSLDTFWQFLTFIDVAPFCRPLSLRAQILKKFKIAWNFQSRLKISRSLEIFNPDLQNSPQKIGVWWVARLKISSSLGPFCGPLNFDRESSPGDGALSGPIEPSLEACQRSECVRRHLSRCHLSVLNFLFIWFPMLSGACSPEEFCEYFFSCSPGNFALKNGGDFWWIFSGLRLSRNEARKVLEKFGAKFGAKFGTKIRKIRETVVLQLFWPNQC